MDERVGEIVVAEREDAEPAGGGEDRDARRPGDETAGERMQPSRDES